MLGSFLFRIKDHRRKQGQRYQLGHILLFSVLAILSGADSYRKVKVFIVTHYDTLNDTFDLNWKRMPSHTTIRDIIQGRSIADAAVFVDTKLQIVLVNPACTRIFGYNPSELKGKSARILFVDNAEYLAAEKNRSNSQITAYIPLFECRYRRKDGSIFPGETIVSPVIDQKGQSMGFLSIIRDITERKKMENDIRHLAYHDTLTGLSNRDVFMDHLELAITQSHRDKQRPAVLFLDLDRFKHINDAFGHAAGDQVLKEVAITRGSRGGTPDHGSSSSQA